MFQDKNHLFLDADDPTVRNILNNPNTEQLKSIMGNIKVVFIDEAQRIPRYWNYFKNPDRSI